MIRLLERSLQQKREEKNRIADLEQSVTEQELNDIEKDRQITDLELAILELQKGE